MIKENQAKFYHVLGSLVTQARVAKGLTVAQLCKLSGEQNKTIRGIEKGRPCNMHQFAWMSEILEIDLTKTLDYQEISNGSSSEEKESEESSKIDVLSSLI